MTLTDEGRRFYEEVRPHLSAIEDAATCSPPARSRRCAVASGCDIDPFFLPLVLAGRLGGFCERYPELSIEFVTSERHRRSVSEGIDLAIRFGEPRLCEPRRRGSWIEAPILTVASPRYLKRWQTSPWIWPAIAACNSSIPIQADRSSGSSFRQGDGRRSNQRPAHLHRSQVDAAGVRRRHGCRPDHRLGCQLLRVAYWSTSFHLGTASASRCSLSIRHANIHPPKFERSSISVSRFLVSYDRRSGRQSQPAAGKMSNPATYFNVDRIPFQSRVLT